MVGCGCGGGLEGVGGNRLSKAETPRKMSAWRKKEGTYHGKKNHQSLTEREGKTLGIEQKEGKYRGQVGKQKRT